MSWRNDRDSSKAGFEKRQKRRQIRALQEAIDCNNLGLVTDLLQEDFDVDFQYRSQTALQLAVKEGCLEICKLLIAKGANVNMCDAEQNNLLNMACYRGFQDIAILLVENGADIDSQNIHGADSVHTCAINAQVDILQVLISANGNLDIVNQHGQTALHVAVKCRNVEVMELLVLGGCKVDKADEHRRTPLSYTAELGYVECAMVLINSGANVNIQDNTGSTPLYEAVKNGHLNVVQVLVDAGADVNLATTKGISPLLEAITSDRADIAMYLIEHKCDVNQTNRLSQAPIHAAVSRASLYFNGESVQSITLIKMLVEAGCDLNLPNKEGERPLFLSACGGNIEATKYLLTRDVDLSVKTAIGDTILHGGVHGNKSALVDMLINAGCTLNERNDAGEHALLTAVIYKADFEIVSSLVRAGSNLDMKDKACSNTPLHNAILHYYSDAGVFLIDSGCDVNILNSKQKSPLYLACEKNDVIAQKILESPKFSKTTLNVPAIPQPLYAAIENDHVRLVDKLIHVGCDINMVNINGFSPIQLAIEKNSYFVIRLLLKYNCDLNAHAKISRLMKCCLQHDDRHPHFDLEPLFLSLTHRTVDMLQLLIQCYWHVPAKTIRMLDHVFKSTPDLNMHYSPELKAQLHELFQRSIRTPRTLHECCRASLRELIGAFPEAKVLKLTLAQKLQSYILMDEYFGNLFEEIKQNEMEHPANFCSFHSISTY